MVKPSDAVAVITVSRLWHSPSIETTVTVDGISLKMSLDDFREALKKEMPHPFFVWRRKSVDGLMDKAFERIVRGIKEESVKVVNS